MIETSPTIAEICKGLHGAQGVLTGVFKGKVNPAFKSKYANLETVLDTIRPGLQANGLVVTQAPGRIVDGCLEVTTMLIHTSGEWWKATAHVPLVKRDPQGMGSATTYGLRYSLMAALGVPPSEDDDGERAMDRSPPAGADPHRRFPAVPHTNGKPIELSDSLKMAGEMMAKLWKVSGKDQVKTVTDDPDFRRTYELLEADDAARVKALAAERRAI